MIRRLWARADTATLGTLVAAGMGQAILVVSGVVAARVLGPTDRGYLALVLLVPTVLFVLGNLGLPLATAYFVAQGWWNTRATLLRLRGTTAIQVGVLTGLHGLLVLTLFSDDPARVQIAGVLTLVMIPVSFALEYGLAILQGSGRFTAFNVARVGPAALYSLALVPLALFGAGTLATVTVVSVLAYWCAAAASLWVALRGLATEPPGRAPERRELLRFGLKGVIGWISPTETLRIDQAVVGFLIAPAALGLYVVALALTNLPRFIAQSLGYVAFPRVAGQTDRAEARRTMWRFFWLSLALSVAVLAVLELSAGWIITTFFGEAFAGATTTARILLIGTLFVGMRRILGDGARGLGHPALGSIAEIASWIVLVPALAVLVPRLEVKGVAIAFVLSNSVSALVLVVGMLLTLRAADRALGLMKDDG